MYGPLLLFRLNQIPYTTEEYRDSDKEERLS